MTIEYDIIKRLDMFTVDYISERITDLQVKNFEEYGNKIEYARGRDDAYRTCARIFSDIHNYKNILESLK